MGRATGSIDIIKLIEVCGQMGVYKLKWRDLEVEFGAVWPQRPKVDVAADLADNEEQGGDEVSEDDSELVREMKAAEMLIEDPEMYEKMRLGGEI